MDSISTDIVQSQLAHQNAAQSEGALVPAGQQPVQANPLNRTVTHIPSTSMGKLQHFLSQLGNLQSVKGMAQAIPFFPRWFLHPINSSSMATALTHFNQHTYRKAMQRIMGLPALVEGFYALSNAFSISPHLLSLKLPGIITTQDILNIAPILQTSCPNLQHIDLDNCWDLTDQAIIAITQACPNLQHINLRGCYRLTDQAIIELAQRCPHLQNIDLGYCAQLTDQAIIELAQECPNLQKMKLKFCNKLTDNAILALTQNLKNLKYISLPYCRNISLDDAQDKLRKAFPGIIIGLAD